jgi:predicted nucleotidyltransferase
MTETSHILEELLGGPGRIAVMRALVFADSPLTGRQVAIASGLSHAGAMRALDRFVRIGIVDRVPVGRALLHQLDRDHEFVTELALPLFESEAALVGIVALESASDDPRLVRINARVRSKVSAIESTCRRHHVKRAALFGSATQVDDAVVPADLDILVTFEPLAPRVKAEHYAALSSELERIMGMPVDVMVSTAVRNPYLREELERTQVVLYEVA